MRFLEFKSLLEYDRSKTIAAAGAGIISAAQRDSYLKSQGLDQQGLVDAVVTRAEESDPTKNKQYVQWIVRQFVKQGLKFEDISKLKDHLETFVSTKGQHKRLKINSDVNQYNWQTLADTARKLGDTEIAEPDEADATKVSGAKILYDGPLGTLSVPQTQAASCELGRGTEWCTAATKSNNMFDHYNKQGPLYIWHDKKKKTKYQFHFESGQIMDAQDRPVSDAEARYLASENPITSKLVKKNARVTIDAYTEYLEYHAEPPDDDDDDYGYGFDDPPDEEIIDSNIEFMFAALDDAEFASLSRTAMTDSTKEVDVNKFKNTWFNELARRPQLHEKIAAKQPFTIPIKYALATGKRSAEMEKALLSAKYNSRGLYDYAKQVIRGPWPEAEPYFEKEPVYAFMYATQVLKDRFPAGESEIKKSERNWNQYKEQFGLTDEI